MSDWQPIETAPRDGTRVLLWTDTNNDLDRPFIDLVCDGDHFAACQIGYWETAIDAPLLRQAEGWHAPSIGQPTHWMPLPPPPVGQ